MLDSKFFFTLIGLIVAVFAICNTNMSPSIDEGFFPHLTVRRERECYPKNGSSPYTLNPKIQHSMLGNEKFVSYPNLATSAPLAPRFLNTQFNANIKYNMPDQSKMPSYKNPLDFASMAENSHLNKPSDEEKFDIKNSSGESNFDNIYKEIKLSDNTKPVIDGIPVDMETVNSLGELNESICYDRLIYSQKKSRTYRHGCHIRGDLPIPKDQPKGWFSVSRNENDLLKGALHHISDQSPNYNMANDLTINSTINGDIDVSSFI